MNNYFAGFSNVNIDPYGPVPAMAFGVDVNKTLYNFGSGAYYRNNRFYAGLLFQEFVRNRLNDGTINVSDITARQSKHAYLATGYTFSLGFDFNLRTSLLVKGVRGARVQGDFNATLWVKEVLEISAEYRTSADISAMMEINLAPE